MFILKSIRLASVPFLHALLSFHLRIQTDWQPPLLIQSGVVVNSPLHLHSVPTYIIAKRYTSVQLLFLNPDNN